MPEHLSAEEIVSFRNGKMPYPDWEKAFEHAKQCVACKDAVYSPAQREKAARDLLSKLKNADERALAAKQKEPKRFRWGFALPVLGVLTAMILVVLVWTTQHSTPFTEAERREVQRAIDTRRIDIPPAIAGLRGKAGVLLGRDENTTWPRLIRPVGTAVASTTPTFEWSPVENSEYQVRVFRDYAPVESSPWLKGNSWLASRALERSSVYTWQLAVRNGKQETVVPVAPQPEARFLVSRQQDADAAASLKQRSAASPLETAILLGHMGFVDDARSALESALGRDPQKKSLLLSLRESLDRQSQK